MNNYKKNIIESIKLHPDSEKMLFELVESNNPTQVLCNFLDHATPQEKGEFRRILEELLSGGYIHIKWADNLPYMITLTNSARNYCKHLAECESYNERNTTQEKVKSIIFISHRSTDKKIADMLVDFFTGTGISKDSVFCSSLPGNDINERISDEVKTALKNSAVNIAILSQDYYQSVYCLNEAGVIWYRDVPVIPIALPEIDSKNMYGFLNNEYKLRSLESSTDVSYIFDTVSEAISSNKVKVTVITNENNKIRAKYSDWIKTRELPNSLYPTTNPINSSEINTDLKNNGIKRIYPKGQAIKSLEEALKSDRCNEIKILAFSAEGFMHSYRSEITKFVACGGHLKCLLSKQDTLFIKQASEMEGRSENAIAGSINSSIEIILSIYKDAKNLPRKNRSRNGTIEIRLYDTEIRNQLILCTDRDNCTSAWMSILIPPLAAVNCSMIEYSDTRNCIDYFNTIWNRHEKDRVPFDF